MKSMQIDWILTWIQDHDYTLVVTTQKKTNKQYGVQITRNGSKFIRHIPYSFFNTWHSQDKLISQGKSNIRNASDLVSKYYKIKP
jgi:hypothetical protein